MPDAGSAYLNRPIRTRDQAQADFLRWDELSGEPRPRTGIYARQHLPSPTYDHLFRLTRGPRGECRCRFKIGCGEHDWWEDVTPPEGWAA